MNEPMVVGLFTVPASLIKQNPWITMPCAYYSFGEYEDNFTYLKHAEILRDRFLRTLPLPAKTHTGLAIVATFVAIKAASENTETRTDYLIDYFKLEALHSRIHKMEQVFLTTIKWQVSVEYQELKPLFPIRIWNKSTYEQAFEMIEYPIPHILCQLDFRPPMAQIATKVDLLHKKIQKRRNQFLWKGLMTSTLILKYKQLKGLTLRQAYQSLQLQRFISKPHIYRLYSQYKSLELTK